jgi:hypothetical protein
MDKKYEFKENSANASRIPGMAYARVNQDLELPILDITSSQFSNSINLNSLAALKKDSQKQSEAIRSMPESLKTAVAHNSLIFGNYFNKATGGRFLSGMSTYILKLGPYLLRNKDERSIDWAISNGIGSMAARMRLRDICQMQAALLNPLLIKYPIKKLCLLNIAGGAASDSINTLILLHREDSNLLKRRQIEIHILDIDNLSPAFALRCIEELKKSPYHFSGLDITVYQEFYNWECSKNLQKLLHGNRDSLISISSEGGLFEYGRDEDILSNLDMLYNLTPSETPIIADIFHDRQTVDPTLLAMSETSGATMRFLGLKGFMNILKNTRWELASILENNPVYLVYALKKKVSE